MNLVKGCLLQSVPSEVFYRVALVTTEQVRLVKLGDTKPAEALSKSLVLQNAEVSKRGWREVTSADDPFLYPEMRKGVSSLSGKALEECTKRWNVLEPVVTSARQLDLFERRSSAALINELSANAGVSEASIRRWFSDYFFFGCNQIACIGDRFNRGGRNKARIGKGDKAGRYSVVEKVLLAEYLSINGAAPPWKRIGKPLNEKEIEQLESVVLECCVKQAQSIPKAYQEFLRRHYVRFNQVKDENDTPVPHRISPELVPTIGQFRYRATLLLQDPKLKELKVGRKDYNEQYAVHLGSSSDIAPFPLDVFDCDGTPFPIEICGGLERVLPIGNVEVILIVDRASHAIVGFSDGLSAENWDSYRAALFSAFNPKDDLLEELKLHPKRWPLFGIPRALYFDNGPGASEDAANAIVDRLKLRRMLQPVANPLAKAIVESAVGKLQHTMKDEPGSWSSGSSARARLSREKAASRARLLIRGFRKALVEAIVEHNQTYVLPRSALTKDMADAGLLTPEHVFQWGKKQPGRNAIIQLTPSEIYQNLLRNVADGRDVSSTGVEIDHENYSCPELMAHYKRWVKVGPPKGDKFHVELLADPLRPGRYYWFDPEGKLRTLIPNSRNLREQLLGATMLDEMLTRTNRQFQIAKLPQEQHKKNKRTPSHLTVEQVDILKDAERATGHYSKSESKRARQAEAAREAAHARKKTNVLLPPSYQDNHEEEQEVDSSSYAKHPEKGNEELEQAFEKLFKDPHPKT